MKKEKVYSEKQISDMFKQLSSKSLDKTREGDVKQNRQGASPLFETKESLKAVSESQNLSAPCPAIPKWYSFKEKNALKHDLIKQLQVEYEKPVKHGSQSFTPADGEKKAFHDKLRKLPLKKLVWMFQFKDAPLKIGLTDVMRKGFKRKHALLITVMNDNRTADHFIAFATKRCFSRQGMKYIINVEEAILDVDYRMPHLYYFENNPFPIQFRKNELPEGTPDGLLLENTLHFEFLTALAQVVRINKKLDITMVFAILAFACSAATTIICLKGFKMI